MNKIVFYRCLLFILLKAKLFICCFFSDYSQSSQVSTKSFKPSFTFSLSLDHSLNLLSTADYELSTSSNNVNVPVLTSSNNSIGSIMIIGTIIGGLIALFLLVIIIQSCVKLRQKKRAKQTSSKTDVGPEVDPYETIEEIINTATGEISEQQQHSKYYQLKKSNLETTLPYQQMKNQSQYQEIGETCQSSKSSSSSISNMSYLEPNTAKNESRNYLEVLGSNGTTCIEGSPTCSVYQNVNDPSTQYLDPIRDVNLPQLESNSNSDGDNSTYLDVTVETFL